MVHVLYRFMESMRDQRMIPKMEQIEPYKPGRLNHLVFEGITQRGIQKLLNAKNALNGSLTYRNGLQEDGEFG